MGNLVRIIGGMAGSMPIELPPSPLLHDLSPKRKPSSEAREYGLYSSSRTIMKYQQKETHRSIPISSNTPLVYLLKIASLKIL